MIARIGGHGTSMGFLFRLPFLLLEALLRRVLGHNDQDDRFPPRASAPVAPASAPAAPGAGASFTGTSAAPSANGAPPPPTADEAIERRVAREAAEAATVDLTPPTPLRPIGDAGHLDEDDVTLVESFGPADDVGATITVDEPWDGYAQQSATAIVGRLRGADPATKAVVALYERGHKRRATVLRAAG
jgi:hypothetical protein